MPGALGGAGPRDGLGKMSGRVAEFLWVFGIVGRFPWDPGSVSYPPGPIVLCFCGGASVDENLPVR